MAHATVKPMKQGLEEQAQEQVHRIRITLSSKCVKNIEKVCPDRVRGAKDKRLWVKGPVRMPTTEGCRRQGGSLHGTPSRICRALLHGAPRSRLPRSPPCFQKLSLHSLHSDRLLRRDAPLRLLSGRPFSPLRAVALDSDQSRSSPLADEGKPRRYYFVVANAKFMLDEEEHFQEQLSERLRHFGEHNREYDFWLVVEPKFLDKFPEIAERLKRPTVALVSTDGPWITQWRSQEYMEGRHEQAVLGTCERSDTVKRLIYTGSVTAASPLDVQGLLSREFIDESC